MILVFSFLLFIFVCVLLLILLYHFLIRFFFPFRVFLLYRNFHDRPPSSHSKTVFYSIKMFFSPEDKGVLIGRLSYHTYLFLSFSFSLSLSLSPLFGIYGRVLFESVAHFFLFTNKSHVLHLSRLFYDNQTRNRTLAWVIIHAGAKQRLDVLLV